MRAHKFPVFLLALFLPKNLLAFSKTYEEGYPSITVAELQKLLFTEFSNEIVVYQDENTNSSSRIRNLKGDALFEAHSDLSDHDIPTGIHNLWMQMNHHAWFMAESLVKTSSKSSGDTLSFRRLQSHEEQQPYPFIVCNRSPLFHTGNQRFWPTVYAAGSERLAAIPISNEDNQTCFHLSSTAAKAKYLDTMVSTHELVIIPLIDILKIPFGTIDEVSKSYWRVPSPSDYISSQLKQQPSEIHWERVIHVALSPGLLFATDQDLVDAAKGILMDVEGMAKVGSERRRYLKDGMDSSLDEGSDTSKVSIKDSFSLLSNNRSPSGFRMLKEVSSSRLIDWARYLEDGLEADHRCSTMLSSLSIQVADKDLQMFDIILNPFDVENLSSLKKWDGDNIEASASNVNCIVSLIMALSVHPHVVGVDADVPITPDDFQAQWITQSKVQGKRPFNDVGLTGAGQIVSVSDSGLDISQSFLGPTSSKVYSTWSMGERKVVRYDSSSGDQYEPPGGHGTSVASVIAGKLSGTQENEADGIARDAKIVITDLQVQYRGFSDPGPSILFSSFYNGGKGAKVTNGSWSSSFRPYSFRCRMYDQALYSQYSDVLFVSSAGNFGKNQPNASRYTVGDPASCKNIMAVGASQSAGERIYIGDLGVNYLADFSSRGPTSDGRFKPDIVAPGYMVLTARAGSTQNTSSTFETFGTSFSSPVIAGCAALVRQYFEEGWFPCGYKGCAKAIYPVGSLIKAILMNGAQSLNSVQYVPKGPTLLSLKDYDSNQGMGLVNMIQSLPLKNQNDINSFVANGRTIMDGGSHTLLVQAKSCGNSILSATLVWYDPAGANACANCLLNDLDISVENVDTSGKRIGPILYPNGLNAPDRKNNAERIRLQSNVGSRYRITIQAHNLSTQSQNYSLAVAGCFDVLSST